ncbi:MAG TPA: ABC transporter ATP-binding protein [Mycobacteriales bacterium]|nr:ABC transporter ATP-binding protein [Mycobacteriales bacterium]
MTTSVRFENVSKRYSLGGEPTLVSRMNPRRNRGLSEVWALRDVSFVVEQGETVAIVGSNGSGKTTTLRMVAGISAPTSGRIRVEGSVAPLIGIGVGFNPELSGRENVAVNGQLLGLSQKEIRRNFDAIVEFSEIEAYLDTPVKFYSSGMYLRLGFAVAVHTRPEILVVDEILAVGDAAFQAKCNIRMRELRDAGTTIVLVTHNLNLAVRMSKRTIVLSRGELVFDGDSTEGVGVYHEMLSEIRDVSDTANVTIDGEDVTQSKGQAKVSLDIRNHAGDSKRQVETGRPFSIFVTIEFTEEVEDPCIGIGLTPAEGHDVVASVFTAPGEYRGKHGPGRPLHAEVRMENHLLTRSYIAHAVIYDSQRKWLLGLSPFESFYVKSPSKYFGTTDLHSVLTINGTEMSNVAVVR